MKVTLFCKGQEGQNYVGMYVYDCGGVTLEVCSWSALWYLSPLSLELLLSLKSGKIGRQPYVNLLVGGI